MIWKPNPSANKKTKFKLLVTVAALSFIAIAGCTNTGSEKSLADRDTMKADRTKVADADVIDFNSPVESYDEIRDTTIHVQGASKYSIYNVNDDVMFDVDKSTLRKPAEAKLHNIAESMDKHFKNGKIGIYGYTDSVGTANYNKDLARERANTVRNWFIQHENIPTGRIAVLFLGQTNPISSNDTKKGRQKNRSVEIVVTKGNLHDQ